MSVRVIARRVAPVRLAWHWAWQFSRRARRELRAVLVTPVETHHALRDAPVTSRWKSRALKTQMRLTRANGPCRVGIGDFEIESLSAKWLASLHREIFIDLSYYFRASRPAPVIVDGGSNIGVSVAFFKTLYPDARVIAFEPAQRAFELLERNVGSAPGVELHRFALGRSDAPVTFYESDDPGLLRQSTRAERLHGTASTSVEQRRLSEFISGDLDLVKLDVEGAESDVIEDLAESGAIEHVQQLVVEYHHQIDPDRDSIGAFLERLRELGFYFQLSAHERVAYRNSPSPKFQDILVHAYRRPAPG
jgi:FkbM family methyltransferase